MNPRATLLAAALILASCAAPVAKQEPLEAPALFSTTDESINVTLEAVIVRTDDDAPAREPRTDEYRLRIEARKEPVQVKDVALINIVRNRVALQAARPTPLPATITPGKEQRFTLIFPVTPFPKGIEVIYADARGERRLTMDTAAMLSEAHTRPKLLVRGDPQFPIDAMRQGFKEGYVRARLTIAPNGTVDKVEVLESDPPGYFEREAGRTMVYWRYNVGVVGRTVEEVLEFKR